MFKGKEQNQPLGFASDSRMILYPLSGTSAQILRKTLPPHKRRKTLPPTLSSSQTRFLSKRIKMDIISVDK